MSQRNVGTYLPNYTASRLGSHLSSLKTLIKVYALKVADECFRMSECLRIILARNLNTAQAVWSTAEGTDGMNGTVTADEN
jgi:hypothetical protein